jgi:hypothetical protein
MQQQQQQQQQQQIVQTYQPLGRQQQLHRIMKKRTVLQKQANSRRHAHSHQCNHTRCGWSHCSSIYNLRPTTCCPRELLFRPCNYFKYVSAVCALASLQLTVFAFLPT